MLLLLILGVVQFALWQHASRVAQAAAQQGLAAARVQGGGPAAGQAQVNTVLDQLGTTVLVDPRVTSRVGAEGAVVTVTGHAEAVIPFLTLPVRATAVGPIERFTANLREFTNTEAANGGNLGANGP